MVKRILVTNDDGIRAPGIIAIVEALARVPEYDVRVVSPTVEQSAKGHSITITAMLSVHKFQLPEPLTNVIAFAVNGTPADCVKVALLSKLFEDGWQPDLVVSGINRGGNFGLLAHYSGTLGAAREANICGIPSVALSLAFISGSQFDHFQLAANYSVEIIAKAFDHVAQAPDIFNRVMFNVNFPNISEEKIKGWKFTRQGYSQIEDKYVKDRASSSADVINFRLEGTLAIKDEDESYDAAALFNGWISVSVLGIMYRINSAHFDEVNRLVRGSTDALQEKFQQTPLE
eukprot:TRINITY_DN2238_c2_g1_i1.p1 TRINITY_DN2238_c2_g1~~TRINITY_DN2238_c2_g1_i1.p1  ORF type:complete len:332 (-),score=130.22 TRINITY_DN2238_c2_g1_i1:81-944(-)